MINKYITATILALAAGGATNAQNVKPSPRLVVNITIERLRTDYMEAFLPNCGNNGFKKLIREGIMYPNAQYPFAPTDKASSIAAVITGTSPSNNGITGTQWLNKATLIPTGCTDDDNCNGLLTHEKASPKNIATTTINDELKISTDGKAVVYSIATDRDAAIIAGGHAADGALWFNPDRKKWCSSDYYFKKLPKWIDSYNSLYSDDLKSYEANTNVTEMALQCVTSCGMGLDDVPDMLSVFYDATPTDKEHQHDRMHLKNAYIKLDREIEKLTSKIENRFGRENVLFVISGTGCREEKEIDYAKYRIPCGTFYINRTANLLNMYLSAIYGQDKYVESCFYNQIFLNIKQIETKRISMADILSRAQSFLIQNSGVKNVLTTRNIMFTEGGSSSQLRNWYNPDNCGDLVIELTSGWRLLNEDNGQQYVARASIVPIPVFFYGGGNMAKTETAQVSVDRIAPTIAKAIRIRAPNACNSVALPLIK